MMMTTSTVLSRDELDGPSPGPSSSSSAFGVGDEEDQHLQKPALPLAGYSQAKPIEKSAGWTREEVTGWNFERGSGSISSGQQHPLCSTPLHQPNQGQSQPSLTSRSAARAPIATVDEANFHSGRYSLASSSMCESGHLPDGFVGGGSCRLSNASSNTYSKRRQRPALPCFVRPPDASQARNTIHEHLRTLLPSHPRSSTLPKRATVNAIAVMVAINSNSSSCPTHPIQLMERCTLLPGKQMKLVRRFSVHAKKTAQTFLSVKWSIPPAKSKVHLHSTNHAASRTSILVRSNEQLSFVEMKAPPPVVFSMTQFHKEGETDFSFLGREWLFKELYQTAVVEKAPVTLIQGANGSGKSAVLNQLVLNSPFFLHKGTNADTVDSGIVVGSTGSQTSLNSSTNFSSRNYEWLRMVACRVISFHTCHLYCASTCSIPEFVRNLCSYMCASPLLRPYTERIGSDDRLYQLATSEAASLEVDPVELFRLLVIQPLAQLNVNQLKWDSCFLSTNEPRLNGKSAHDTADTTCLIVSLIDGVDEAGFHRNDGDESIGWLLKQTSGEFPPWLRFIVTSSTITPFYGLDLRTIRLDDVEVDERVLRDSRLYIDYHFTINPALEERVRERRCSTSNPEDGLMEFVEEMLKKSRGNHLFLSLLLKMIEEDRIRLKATSLSLLPTDLNQLYLLHFNLNFTSLSLFHIVAPILSVLLASLKPMRFKELLKVLNAGQSEPRVSEKELNQRLGLLSPMIVKLSSGVYVPLHQSFREWLLKESSETDYFVDVRYGHILLSLSLVRQGNLQSEQLFELGHHLLKANPHKYLQLGVAPDMPTDRGAQIAWIRMAVADNNIAEALLFSRNTFYPNSKVTRLLLLAGANPNCVFHNGQSLCVVLPGLGTVTCSNFSYNMGLT
uniref:Uncharacterized protein n=1 Tax=Ditylenchus dipsaci TaxID=166011 RepID=A0A915DGC7_9BILA